MCLLYKFIIEFYLSNLVALQSNNFLWQFLVRCVTEPQSAIVSITKGEELSICSHHS